MTLASLRQQQLEAKLAIEQSCSAEARVKAFEGQLEDASVAILGFQVDLVREKRRIQELDRQQSDLRQRLAQLQMDGPVRSEQGEDGKEAEEGSEDTVSAEEVVRLRAATSVAEATLAEDEARLKALRAEETVLQTMHNQMAASLKTVQNLLQSQQHCSPGSDATAPLEALDSARTQSPLLHGLQSRDEVETTTAQPTTLPQWMPDQRNCPELQDGLCATPREQCLLEVDPAKMPVLPGYAALSRAPPSICTPLATERSGRGGRQC